MLEKELCQVLWAFLKVVLSGSEERVVADRKVGIMHVYRYGNMEADIVLFSWLVIMIYLKSKMK